MHMPALSGMNAIASTKYCGYSSLSGTGMQSEGLRYVVDALRENTTLQILL